MKKTALALALLATTGVAQAQSKNFEGAFGTFGVASVSNSLSTTLNNGRGASLGLKSGDTGTTTTVSGGYNFILDDKFLVGLSASYDLSNVKAGTISGAQDSQGAFDLTAKMKNHWAIAVEPGYAFSNNAMGYLKLSYNKAKGELAYGDSTLSTKFNGVGLGVGTRIFLDKNLFLQVEGEQISYSSKTWTYANGESESYKPKSTIARFSIGYKF
ncbi:outer membrane beta-barrel protein [Polynucleobacter sp. MWH-Loch1C5]|uniref:outer membrane beta-barrel protein n=1 Tax=Polynucleobacter sp. MWH-Loch1C5 TaxID=2689108 RepID=UPI001C0DCBD5|nr:outer membrane beta-barrel protein [Polynucleobacter sp. MWH-Loch1C5]MBU3542489.1 outer membrane beta-barrel protein [Polynucleobacter sp. MWH-Loch1C5]